MGFVPDDGTEIGQEQLALVDLPIEQIPVSLCQHNTAQSLSFPLYSPSSCHSDSQILDMIKEARREHHLGRFDVSRPSLRRLLSDIPVDCLSFRLFHYISRFGPAPLQNLLAVFWVQYLYLRVRLSHGVFFQIQAS